jgi:phosphatidylinositol-3,4,5-trisphosphate 3-phosphatase and dual-specificity protein phosphatase PTEN
VFILVDLFAGKGRTGTVICSYLLFKGICENPEAALLFFKKKRSSKDKGGSVDEPSQVRFQKKQLKKRYINYFYKIIKKKLEIKQSLYSLKKICVNNVSFI